MSKMDDTPAEVGYRPAVDDSQALDEGEEAESVLDPRAALLQCVSQYVDMPEADARVVMEVAVYAYNTFVLLPTRTTWRKDEGSRRELERDLERVHLREMAEDIQKGVAQRLGGTWHVVYGRDFATYVTHQTQFFLHFQLEGADIVVWRHAG